ncbi:MAG: hypothetical protein R6W68_00775 [Ignavibacteriaceae bacterium]
MLTSVKKLIVFFLFIFLSASCADKITNYYGPPEGNPPDVNVIYSSYSLETIHSIHFDTTSTSGYTYSINLSLKLDKPDRRNQINKIIIVNEYGTGWELFNNELESFYSGTLGGYELKNLIYRTSTQYSPSIIYRVKLYSSSNVTAADYEFLLYPDFISSQYITHNWYTQNIYQIIFDSYNPPFNFTGQGEIIWLNENKSYLSETSFISSDIESGRYLRTDVVPAEAYYFYIHFKGMKNGIQVGFKSDIYSIAERYPDNIQILNENIYNIDVVKYVPELQKIFILDRSYNSLYIIDYNTLNLVNKVTFSYRPYSITYSDFDDKVYIGFDNGRLYSMTMEETTPSLVKNFGSGYLYSLLVVNKYLIVSLSNNSFGILNLEDNTLQTETNYSYYNCYNMVFNKTMNVVYGYTNYNGVLRFNFNPASGEFSDYSVNYSGSSSYFELLLYSDDSKIITSSGNIYNCSENIQNDLTSYGSLGQNFASGSFSNDNNGIVTLRRGYYSSDPSEIIIYSKNNLETIGTKEDFWGNPRYLIVKGDIIKIISGYNSGIIAESYSYSQIISGLGKPGNIVKAKYYLPKELKF